MKFKASVLFTFLLLLVPALFAGSAAIVLKSQDVHIDKDKILLSDIADLVNIPYEDSERLGSLYIRRAAAPGFKVEITKEYVINKLTKEVQYAQVEGPVSVNVFTSKAAISRDDIESFAKQYVLSKMEWDPADTEIRVKHSKGDISVIEGAPEFKVRQGTDIKWKGNVVIPVDIYIDGKFYRIEPVSMVIKVNGYCAQATGEIQRHTAITPDMVTMQAADITYLPDNIITDYSKLTNKSSKRTISRGSVLTTDMFESLPAFRRGAEVQVTVRVKNISIASEGTALSDGREGDRVKVKLSGGKTVEGTVDASGAVIIEK
jgi:flagella basal body P-ring formation protein FlgA